MKTVLSFVALAVLASCAAPKLAIGPPPALADFETPPPKPPAAQEVPSAGDEPVEVEVAQARPAPDFREKFLGLAALDGPDADLPRKVESFLSFDLLRRGITRFVDLSPGKAIQVSIERGKSTTTPASKDDTRWQSSLDKMFFLGRVSRADYIAYGTFLEARTVAEQREVKFKLDDKQLEDYRRRHTAWANEGKQAAQRLASDLASYTSEFEAAQRKYLDDGGKFESSPPNPAKIALDGYAEFQANAKKAQARVREALASAPAPDKLVEEASARAKGMPVNVAVVEVLVKLMDVDQGEVVWGARLRKRAVADPQQSIDPALRPVLQKFLDLVLANSRVANP